MGRLLPPRDAGVAAVLIQGHDLPMGRIRAILTVTLFALGLTVARAGTVPAEDPQLSVKALVAAATKYVTQYQEEFAFLIADEDYSQTQIAQTSVVQNRELLSELFLTYLPMDNEWVAVRDVVKVDGLAVSGRDDLRKLLSQRDQIRGVAAAVVQRNSRYNIGDVTRTFNEPTLPLLLVGPKRVGNVKFDRGDVVKDGDATLVTLNFAERGRPTLVRFMNGPSVPGKGEFLVEAGTGVVRRTRFEFDQPGLKVRLTTEYARHERLGLWLPVVFTERYERTDSPRETIVCSANYSNYRRFDVTAKIK